ncbi:MAG: BadF/BadG/BcrA/BcrD ATPase family protein [Microbacteriaceae bacterium]
MIAKPAGMTLAIDLGKTSCRARVTLDGALVAESRGVGAPGLADHNGAELSFRAIADAAAATGVDPRELARIGIGAAGVEAGRDAARDLIGFVRSRLSDAPVAVINDALAAHAGAFDGGPGSILITGTGAICFTVTEAGAVTQIDGWGPWLGDEGSGQWIGRHGLQAVLRAHDGRGPSTALTADAAALGVAIAQLPLWVAQSGAPARQLGTFAPTVIGRAEQGDPVAVGIIDEAARLLAVTCAASGSGTVCVGGGLAEHPFFAAQLLNALTTLGLGRVAARGDALDGAALIASTAELPHEGRVIRG